MIYIKNKTVQKIINKKLSDVKVGTTFLGKLSDYEGLFLKSDKGVVFLENPQKTWPGHAEYFVTNYIEVDIEIEIKEIKK